MSGEDICRRCGESCAFCNEDDGRLLGKDDLDAARKDERAKVLAEVEAVVRARHLAGSTEARLLESLAKLHAEGM